MQEEFPEFQKKPEKRLTYREKVLAGKIQKKPGKPLRQVSKKRSSWLAKYNARFEKDSEQQNCGVCGILGTKYSLDRHHTNGRVKENILVYIYACRKCHDWIHGNPKEARQQGYLNF